MTHEHVAVVDPFVGTVFSADVGVIDDLHRLWNVGVRTFASCQGDADHPRYVLVLNEDVDRAREVLDWVETTASGPLGTRT